MRRELKNEAGFSLIEIMLVLAAASAMMVGALALGGRVWESSKVAQARSMAKDVDKAVAERFATFPNFSSLATTPTDWVPGLASSGGNLVGPWGPLALASATVNGPDDSYSLTFNQVPRAGCAEMVSSMSPNFQKSGANGIFSAQPPGKVVDPSEAETLCSAGLNQVVFVAKPSITSAGAPSSANPNPPAASGLPAWTP